MLLLIPGMLYLYSLSNPPAKPHLHPCVVSDGRTANTSERATCLAWPSRARLATRGNENSRVGRRIRWAVFRLRHTPWDRGPPPPCVSRFRWFLADVGDLLEMRTLATPRPAKCRVQTRVILRVVSASLSDGRVDALALRLDMEANRCAVRSWPDSSASTDLARGTGQRLYI